MKNLLLELYEGDSHRAVRFRYGLLVFDVLTILFLVGSSFTSHGLPMEIADAVIGIGIVADFSARLWISRHRVADFVHPLGIADIVVIISLLAPIIGEGLAFLRVARMFRLLRSYQLLKRLRQDFAYFRRNEQTISAGMNLAIFLFVMTAFVYETQHLVNDRVANYADALYFTVTTLTTTGFGDITLPGTWGRLLTIMIMISGITMFVRVAQTLIRPYKVNFACPTCGLMRHDPDAVHCKACGTILNIPNEE